MAFRARLGDVGSASRAGPFLMLGLMRMWLGHFLANRPDGGRDPPNEMMPDRAPRVEAPASARSGKKRVAWVDYAKGCCIILVVMMHAVGGYEYLVDAQGWMRPITDFAKPFRMPDFFLISGLFLSRTIYGPAWTYLDRKLVHFAYFYVIWLVIEHTARHPGLLLSAPDVFVMDWFKALVEPTTTLWFIHLLAIFYLVTWVVRDAAKWLVLTAAVILHTGYHLDLVQINWNVAGRFAHLYVYFFIGYAAAPFIFNAADYLAARKRQTVLLLAVWALVNWGMVVLNLHRFPVTSLAMGLAGAAAICAIAAIVAEHDLVRPLRYVGQNSIVVYLTFFLPLNFMEQVFYRVGEPFGSVGLASFLILAVAVGASLAFHWTVRSTPLRFLYERPAVLCLPGTRRPANRKASIAPVGAGLEPAEVVDRP